MSRIYSEGHCQPKKNAKQPLHGYVRWNGMSRPRSLKRGITKGHRQRHNMGQRSCVCIATRSQVPARSQIRNVRSDSPVVGIQQAEAQCGRGVRWMKKRKNSSEDKKVEESGPDGMSIRRRQSNDARRLCKTLQCTRKVTACR